MYACYPEISYLCKNPIVLLERVKQGLQISRKKRKAHTYNEYLDIIKKIKNENLSSKTQI